VKIVKCKSCSCNTHVFTSADGNFKCFSCGKPIDVADAVDKYSKEPFLSLKSNMVKADERIAAGEFDIAKTEINTILGENKAPSAGESPSRGEVYRWRLIEVADGLIAAGNFERARAVVDELLETVPESVDGDLRSSGEMYWRKLLVDAGCKNDTELIAKGKSLRRYSAFLNAMDELGTEDEKRVYTLVEGKKGSYFARLKIELEKKELDAKIKTGAEGLLGEYGKELDALRKQARARIASLERIEEEIREAVIDCGIAAGEYKNSVDAVIPAMVKLKDVGAELTLKQKSSYEKQVNDWRYMSNQEINKLQNLATTDERYLKYSELSVKRDELVSAVRRDTSQINKLREKIEDVLGRIDAITQRYDNAVSALDDGNYMPGLKLMRE